MNIDAKALDMCLDWFGKNEAERGFSKDIVKLISKEDIGEYHRRVYLVAYTDRNDSNGVYIIRIFGEGDSLSLSQDYEYTTSSPNMSFKQVVSLIEQILNNIKS